VLFGTLAAILLPVDKRVHTAAANPVTRPGLLRRVRQRCARSSRNHLWPAGAAGTLERGVSTNIEREAIHERIATGPEFRRARAGRPREGF